MAENEEVAIEVEVVEDNTPDPVEEKARGMGWAPKEEWRGDPEKWKDAKTFVERSENILPIVKERLDSGIKENRELKQTSQELKQTFQEFHKKTAEREFNRALEQVKQRKIEAVQGADVEEYQQAERAEQELLKERQQPATQSTAVSPEFAAFESANDWYKTDPDMRAYADNMGNYIASTRQLPYADMLREVEKEVKARYPHKFQNQRREAAPSVERSAETGLPVKAGKTYTDLPDEARKACDKFVKTIPGFTKEQYLKDYFG